MLSRSQVVLPVFLLVAAVASASACSDKRSSGPSPTTSSTTNASTTSVAPHVPRKAPERVGGALMRSADGQRLYLADEDHNIVRILPLPFGDEPKPIAPASSASASASAAPSASAPPRASASASASASVSVAAKPPPPGTIPPIPVPPSAKQIEYFAPGPPAQVIPIDGYVLVTIRNPGMLLVLQEKPDHSLEESARIPIAPDAWGIALTPDEKIALVTSAWTHTVTAINLAEKKVLWTLDVAREPRGVVIHPDGKRAYISHLTSGELTRIDNIADASAKASSIAFPAAPQRAPQGTTLGGSLGYALVIDDAGNRLLAARHALGALGENNWYGSSTVDVLQMENDKPLLGPRIPSKLIKSTPAFDETKQLFTSFFAERNPNDYRLKQVSAPVLPNRQAGQPRALAIARKTNAVWLASEGGDAVFEMPLHAGAPLEVAKRRIIVGSHQEDPRIVTPYHQGGIAGHCGAPTGLALNEAETLLYVFCRSTYDIATMRIADKDPVVMVARVATDPIDEAGSRGRRIFYSGTDPVSADDLGCAGCHPEGRDDGQVWHEVVAMKDDWRNTPVFMATQNMADKTNAGRLGYPRQTPMLAGRVKANGPYGWHAQSENITDRLAEGFARHRWSHQVSDPKSWWVGERSYALQIFLRKGLVTPPKIERPLTDEEMRGKKVFESDATQCARCHVPASDFSDRTAYEFNKLNPPAGFEEEADNKFKTPSLLFVSGTPPYYHDGHVSTLDAVVMQNNDRMGKTNQLSAADKAALIAYLKTL